jgi:anaerobic magnesium-protoporphyrin IX monomethyl ester cyclase
MSRFKKILIADIYPTDDWRLVKDTAGGYGTGNNFGETLFSKILNSFVGSMISMPAMSSAYVWSILKNQGHSVEYLRFTNKKLPDIEKYDYIILPSSIVAHESEVNFAKFASTKGVKTFVTGIFANVEYKKYDLPNTLIVKGEPENFFLKIDLLNFDFHNYKSNLDYKFDNPLVENLDDLPYPSWDEYVKKYPLKNNFLACNSKIAIPILATRGCPYSCFNYCTYPLQQGRKVRFRDPKKLVDEIEYWIKKLRTNKFIFRDPVFSINRKYTIEICQTIIERKIKIDFLIETHLNNLDDELIAILKKAGLKMVYVGIESSDAKVLNDINRFTIANDKQFEIIKKLKDNGIVTKSMFMLGSPKDDLDSIEKTISYANHLPNELVQFSVFTPYPGTPIFKNFKDKILEPNYEKFNQYNLVYKHENLSDSNLRNFKSKAYRNFYLTLSRIPTVIKYASSIFRY